MLIFILQCKLVESSGRRCKKAALINQFAHGLL